MMDFKATHFFLTILCCFLVSACDDNAQIEDRQTLMSIDDTLQQQPIKKETTRISKSESDIRDAYINYLNHSSTKDLSRSDALNRLASIEFNLSEQLLNETKDEKIAAKLADRKLDRVIQLLQTSLQDYPDAKKNDISLYQLAKVFDQKGEYEKTHETLQKLADNYPKSKYYLEAQFRLAEFAFTKREYSAAEDKYTEIVIARNNNVFYEKALYKRGWSRFKQEFYLEAADDFVRVINQNNFSEYKQLDTSKKSLFDEYFRALGLSFSYLGGVESLNIYLQDSEYLDEDYYIYNSLSAVFLKQQQYNDAASALNSFVVHAPNSKYAPLADLKVIDIWKEAGFIEKRSLAFNHFYETYHPNSKYWANQKKVDKQNYDQINLALKAHILTETATYHKKYQDNNKQEDFLHAQRWYRNYLKHYPLYARQDNIHFLLASLYSTQGDKNKAINHYQLAGFDDQTIINKEAAYHSILLASSLHESSKTKEDKEDWLNKLIDYSTLYAQQYPTDKETLKVIAYGSDTAYNSKQYAQAISLSELAVSTQPSALLNEINLVKANAYFRSQEYEVAESIFLDLSKTKSQSNEGRKAALEGLSLAIFYQGDEEIKNNNIEQAIQHYARINKVAPNTEAAASGLYDAIALSVEHKQWLPAIAYIETFRKLYPSHKFSTDVTKKLSVAYLNSEQGVEAAKELEKLSSNDKDVKYQMASLIKAAQLYQNNNEDNAAIRAYEKYVKAYKTPFSPYLESLYQLTLLNTKKNNRKKSLIWQKQILEADTKAPTNQKNERTNYITSTAAIELARDQNKLFNSIKLVQPLNKHLKQKKQSMQQSVNYYAKASSFGLAETATEATFEVADIYNNFSKSLLTSEIPKHLDEDEQEEYMFLLEDQAFPFEEKAIEFHEINLLYSADGINDQWIQKSLSQLQIIFPVRYQRQPKIENVINVLH